MWCLQALAVMQQHSSSSLLLAVAGAPGVLLHELSQARILFIKSDD
jgi:hypothetical protein